MALMRWTSYPLSPLLFGPHRRLSLPSRSFSTIRSRPVPASASSSISGDSTSSKVLLKEMDYTELEKWVQSHGFRPGQAMMLWKCLYRDNIWAHCHDELTGLNKEFRKMLSANASLKALALKDIITASDGTRKEGADFVHFRRRLGDRNGSDSLQ